MIRNQNQYLIFAFFLMLVFGFISASYIRRNDEFLFFSGILASMFQLYNYPLFENKSILKLYLIADVFFLAISLFVGNHAFSLQFPIITMVLIMISRAGFYRLTGVYPEDEKLKQKWMLWLYNSIIYLLSLGIWILLIFLYLDKSIK